MNKGEFKAESKRMMDLMINSVYTNREIFLRELISNASDAIDKLYYKSLKDENIKFNKEDFYIEISLDKENRRIKIKDTGIGMDENDLVENLGTIAKSGSLDFKNSLDKDEKSEIIGQFGIGFYSSFLVANKVKVLTKKFGQDKAFSWESEGSEGYKIEEAKKDQVGTEITLYLKDNGEDNYDEFLEEHRIEYLVKNYSNYIRYPIKMLLTKSKKVENEDKDAKVEFEEYKEIEVLNSMVPIWKKNKNELKDEDYIQFYQEQRYGFDEPMHWIHINVEGVISYKAILYIPKNPPFDFQSKDYKKGLQLYSNGVLIMDKCEKLLPDSLSFVKGVVDSEDLSLNISREILQEDRQLQVIARNIEKKIISELKSIMKNDRQKYEEFYNNFGQTFKIAIYESYGGQKSNLEDLLLFTSSKEKKLVSLAEYEDRMKDDQDKIYYASGESIDKLDKLPQKDYYDDKGIEVLYLTEAIDEFVIKMIKNYKEKEFVSISNEEEKSDNNEQKEKIEILDSMKDILGDEVIEVRFSDKLGDNPVCLLSRGEVSIEMERVLSSQKENFIKAQKVLEINKNHPVYNKLIENQDNRENLKLYTSLLYDQARLIEGLQIEDPVEYSKNIWKLIK
ncbi:MAG: molecular chaperone HtpG [Peptoniphilaceae bacterium]